MATELLAQPEVAGAATEEQKLGAIRELAVETKVAAKVTTDLLRRPDVTRVASTQDNFVLDRKHSISGTVDRVLITLVL